jgi:hypothetical protein
LTVDNYIVPESKEMAQPLKKGGGERVLKSHFLRDLEGSESDGEV